MLFFSGIPQRLEPKCCISTPSDVALELNFTDTSLISGQDNKKSGPWNSQKLVSRSGHKLWFQPPSNLNASILNLQTKSTLESQGKNRS